MLLSSHPLRNAVADFSLSFWDVHILHELPPSTAVPNVHKSQREATHAPLQNSIPSRAMYINPCKSFLPPEYNISYSSSTFNSLIFTFTWATYKWFMHTHTQTLYECNASLHHANNKHSNYHAPNTLRNFKHTHFWFSEPPPNSGSLW